MAQRFTHTKFQKKEIVKESVVSHITSEVKLCLQLVSTRSTGSSSSNAIQYIPKRSRIFTYQRSFFIRTCRTWNVLPAELRTSQISLASFKRSLFQFYNKALDLYDIDDIRTWRTICPRCNIARTLLCPPTCCFQQFEFLFCFLLIFLGYVSVALVIKFFLLLF